MHSSKCPHCRVSSGAAHLDHRSVIVVHVESNALKDAGQLEDGVVEQFMRRFLLRQEQVLLALATDVEQKMRHALLVLLGHLDLAIAALPRFCHVIIDRHLDVVRWVCLLANHTHLLEQVVGLGIGLCQELLEDRLVNGCRLVFHHESI